MVVEKLPEVNPTFGRVPGRGLLALPISESLQRWNGGEIHDSGSVIRVFRPIGKYRPKEGTRRGGPHPSDLVARLGGAAQGGRLGRPWLPFDPPWCLVELPSR
ncbi:hypothetical protein D1007_43780 [Hordeum vulgare]|nr:hypothetical protein D1007_43780 [Hordeum vulgare]